MTSRTYKGKGILYKMNKLSAKLENLENRELINFILNAYTQAFIICFD
jgi:hypothetical protein